MKAVWNLKNILKKNYIFLKYEMFNLSKYEACVFVKALTFFPLYKGCYATQLFFSKLTDLESFFFLSDEGLIKTGLDTLIRHSFLFDTEFQILVIDFIVLQYKI